MPTIVTVYFDDVVIHCPVIRIRQLSVDMIECLISVGGSLEYTYFQKEP